VSESEFDTMLASRIVVRWCCPLPLLLSVVLRPFLAVIGVDRDRDRVIESDAGRASMTGVGGAVEVVDHETAPRCRRIPDAARRSCTSAGLRPTISPSRSTKTRADGCRACSSVTRRSGPTCPSEAARLTPQERPVPAVRHPPPPLERPEGIESEPIQGSFTCASWTSGPLRRAAGQVSRWARSPPCGCWCGRMSADIAGGQGVAGSNPVVPTSVFAGHRPFPR
jgi:hypothetical protein